MTQLEYFNNINQINDLLWSDTTALFYSIWPVGYNQTSTGVGAGAGRLCPSAPLILNDGGWK